MIRPTQLLFVPLYLLGMQGAEFPQAKISNGKIQIVVALPDGEKGFYRGTRFDWAGMIYSLLHDKHEYYGPWFQGVDASVPDFVYKGADIVASPCTAASGPAEEFVTADGKALGYDEAESGGTFVKIGVGALRKPDEAKYDHFRLYEIANAGKWTVKTHSNSADFEQTLDDPGSGYGYIYRKTIALSKDQSEMRIEHSLRNTGKKEIRTDVYNHNFFSIDRQPPGPDYTLTVPFEIKSEHPPDPNLAEIRRNQVLYLKQLQNEERVSTPMQGFGDTAKDYEIQIENKKIGAGLRITGDRPLQSEFLWSIRAVLCVEPYIRIALKPGEEFTWALTYSYYSPGFLK